MKGAMSNLSGVAGSHERWARFRFSVIGPLLAAPPEWGELRGQLKSLAAKKWLHPITGERVQFGFIPPGTRRRILCRPCAAKSVLTREGTLL
jgi:hypothetical protein